VKTFSKERQRKHFEVHAVIRMPKHQIEFGEEGWSIEEAFENIGLKIKKLMTKPRDSRLGVTFQQGPKAQSLGSRHLAGDLERYPKLYLPIFQHQIPSNAL
jgi:hypothetical protein